MKTSKSEQAFAVAMLACDCATTQDKIKLLQAELQQLPADDLACLYGIAGVFKHALAARMPRKWSSQIAADLIEAMAHFTGYGTKQKPMPDYCTGF